MPDSADYTMKLLEVLVKQAEALIRLAAVIERFGIGEGVDDEVPVDCDHDFYAGVCRNCGATSFLGAQ